MDGQRFDDLTKILGLSLTRKRSLALLGGLLGGSLRLLSLESVEARRRGRQRRPSKRRGGRVGAEDFCFGSCWEGQPCPPEYDECRCTNPPCTEENRGTCCVASQCGQECDVDADCTVAGCPSGVCFDDFCATPCPNMGACDSFDDCDCLDGFGGCNNGTCACYVGGCGVCEGQCEDDSECPTVAGCFCDPVLLECVSQTCSGVCDTNADCTAQGAGDCVCFLGVDTADRAHVEAVVAEGSTGECGVCHGVGQPCDASTECCGQLVCGGTCRHKRRPRKDRCHGHSQSCRRDNDCCAQGVCYKGKCGEKDTHCHNDGECARGYRCQGGPLAPGHRRCRKNGRRPRNKTHRKNG